MAVNQFQSWIECCSLSKSSSYKPMLQLQWGCLASGNKVSSVSWSLSLIVIPSFPGKQIILLGITSHFQPMLNGCCSCVSLFSDWIQFFFLINHLNECPGFFTFSSEYESISNKSIMRKRASRVLPWKNVMYKGSKYSISTVLIRSICISED